MTVAAIFVVFPLCLAIAAFSDLFTMTIPNRVSAIVLASFVVVAPLAGLPVATIGLHLAAALLVFSVCFGLFAANVMGGGDAKLLTASSVWFGLNTSLLGFLGSVALAGGLLTVLVLLLRRKESTILAAGLPVPRLLFTEKKIPYGIAIAAGGLFAYPSSPLMLKAIALALHGG
ncbi:A24 family peptidase [Ensifer soli]|uniref:A24 family peptidase n=1 Tax=Ciceribacter sp. sgz301302 TaxID=3342379 RepID=UPI0035B7D5E0